MIKFFKNLNKSKIRLIFVLSIAVGFILRVYNISKLNIYSDEGVFIFAVKDFLYNNVSAWLTQSWIPPMHTWINSIFVAVFGLNEFSIRIPSAIFGTLSIILIYSLTKLWYGKKPALLAALILAILPVHVVYSRTSFNDVMQTFFLLAAVLASEYAFKNEKKKYWFILLSGISFAFSFLVKYNSVLLWALYWLFILTYNLIKKEKILLKNSLFHFLTTNIVSIIAILLIILLSGGIERLLYAINNFIFLAVVQSKLAHNPFYFHLIVLFDTLSPILALMLPVSILCILLNKRRNKHDMLLIFMLFLFYLIISIQQRRYVRHQIMAVPFLVIAISRSLFILRNNATVKKYFYLFLFLVCSFITIWTVYEISKINDYSPWSDLSGYLNSNYPDSQLYASPILGKIVKYYVPYAQISRRVEYLKKDDLVVFVQLYQNSTGIGEHPLDENLLLYRKQQYTEEYNSEFKNFILSNGELIKTFEFKNRPIMWLYKIRKTSYYGGDTINEQSIANQIRLDRIWNHICDKWRDKNSKIKTIMTRLLSKDQQEAVNMRCLRF